MIDVKALQNGQSVEGQFAVRSKDGASEGLRDYSNKPGRFFVIKVGNATGDIILKYWGGRNPEKATNLFASFEVGDVVFVKGRCTHDSYIKGLVISINEEGNYGSPLEYLKKTEAGEYNLEDFIPALPKEKIKALFSELKGFIQGIEDTHLKGVLERFYENKEFVEVFKKAPAARKHHHNYIGGLLEHTVNVARLCDTISRFYSLDRDLLITGALLHDLGKTKEYSLKASVDITDEGRFIGHLPLTAEMVGKEMGEINDFPQTTKLKIIHMLLSHHGELEFGSPKEPGFPEAMALFHADYMDAYVKNVLQEIEGAGEEEPWIFSRSMGRFIHTGKRPENHIKEESRKSVRENEGRHR